MCTYRSLWGNEEQPKPDSKLLYACTNKGRANDRKLPLSISLTRESRAVAVGFIVGSLFRIARGGHPGQRLGVGARALFAERVVGGERQSRKYSRILCGTRHRKSQLEKVSIFFVEVARSKIRNVEVPSSSNGRA